MKSQSPQSHKGTKNHKGPYFLVWLCLLALGLRSHWLLAEENLAQLKTVMDNRSITVGDILNLKLEVKRPEFLKIAFPSVGSQLGEWTVRNVTRLPAKEIEPGWFSEVLEVQLTVYKTGDFEIPRLEVEALHPNGEKQLLASEPTKVKVQSVLSSEHEELKGIKPQVEIPSDAKPFLMLLAALGALALIIYMAIDQFKKRRKPVPVAPVEIRSPEEIARKAIRILLQKKLVEKGQLKEFYLELSEIIKKYLGVKLGVLSLERTTEEFTRDLRETAIPGEQYRLIREFLIDCDLVKFAKYKPSEEEISRLVQRSLEIVETTRGLKTPEYAALEVSK